LILPSASGEFGGLFWVISVRLWSDRQMPP